MSCRKKTYCRRTWVPAVLIIILLFPLFISAFQNEPEGFRGIKWGANIAELPDMSLAEDSGETKYYHRENDEMKLGDAAIERLAYGFYKGKFFMVLIEFNNFSNFSLMKEAFTHLYGEGDRKSKLLEDYSWHGETVDIMLQYKGISEVGYVAYWFKPIAGEREEDKKERFLKGTKKM